MSCKPAGLPEWLPWHLPVANSRMFAVCGRGRRWAFAVTGCAALCRHYAGVVRFGPWPVSTMAVAVGAPVAAGRGVVRRRRRVGQWRERLVPFDRGGRSGSQSDGDVGCAGRAGFRRRGRSAISTWSVRSGGVASSVEVAGCSCLRRSGWPVAQTAVATSGLTLADQHELADVLLHYAAHGRCTALPKQIPPADVMPPGWPDAG